jgi:hypothetical protein
MDEAEDIISYEDAVREGERRIVFTGPRRYNPTVVSCSLKLKYNFKTIN